jgi:hypothetical protein
VKRKCGSIDFLCSLEELTFFFYYFFFIFYFFFIVRLFRGKLIFKKYFDILWYSMKVKIIVNENYFQFYRQSLFNF